MTDALALAAVIGVGVTLAANIGSVIGSTALFVARRLLASIA